MAANYKAGQFNDAFDPKRLGNWEFTPKEKTKEPNDTNKSRKKPINAKNTPSHRKTFSQHPAPNTSPFETPHAATTPIPKDSRTATNGISPSQPNPLQKANFNNINGKPRVSPKFRSGNPYSISPIGLPVQDIMTRRISPDPNPDTNSVTKAQNPRYQTQTKLRTNPDPLLKKIKNYHLPVIWIIGEPTIHIKNTVRTFCNQLALSLDFKYINLDDKIGEWFERQLLKTPVKYWHVFQQKKNKLSSDSSSNPQSTPQPHPLSLVPSKKGTKIKVQCRLSDSLQALADSFDRSNRKLYQIKTNNATSKNVHPSSKFKTSTTLTSGEDGQEMMNDSYVNNSYPSHPIGEIHLDTREPIKREKIMDLLKYAMIENIQSKGFILDCGFIDRIDFMKFKQVFYMPTVGVYFTESLVDQEMTRFTNYTNNLSNKQKILRSTMEETEKNINAKVKLVKPKYFRRRGKFIINFYTKKKISRPKIAEQYRVWKISIKMRVHSS